MSLPLSPEILAAQYEALRICPPFVRWKLPPCEDITFCVIRHKDREGDYTRIIGTDNHFIRISETRLEVVYHAPPLMAASKFMLSLPR